MKICWTCAGTGNLFAGTKPLRWTLCIACKSSSFIEGKPIEPASIKMHRMPKLGVLRRHESVLSKKELEEKAFIF